MRSIYDITPEERKQANPEGLRYLIDVDKQRLQNNMIPLYIRRDIQKELIFLEGWLKEVT